MAVKIGDELPKAVFMTMVNEEPVSLASDDLFVGKRVLLFALPGAFTPTCSAEHLPGYIKNHDALKAKGIDVIACLSVNDVFVMHAWGQQQGVEDKIIMLADGNGDFTRSVGLEMDGRAFFMGNRSQRYAMLVNDGVVENIFVEEAGEFEVSSAEYMLDNL